MALNLWESKVLQLIAAGLLLFYVWMDVALYYQVQASSTFVVLFFTIYFVRFSAETDQMHSHVRFPRLFGRFSEFRSSFP
jgi:hypothetical protein